jgi:hypothetical protein
MFEILLHHCWNRLGDGKKVGNLINEVHVTTKKEDVIPPCEDLNTESCLMKGRVAGDP